MTHNKEKFTSNDFKEAILTLKVDNGIFTGIEKKYLN